MSKSSGEAFRMSHSFAAMNTCVCAHSTLKVRKLELKKIKWNILKTEKEKEGENML